VPAAEVISIPSVMFSACFVRRPHLRPCAWPVPTPGNIYVRNANNLHAFRPDGSRLWSFMPGGATIPMQKATSLPL
jgi:hypothetical protein